MWTLAPEQVNVLAALQAAGAWLRETRKIEPIAVGHRVVDWGAEIDRPVLIDHDIVADVERYTALAFAASAEQPSPSRSILARHASASRLFRYGFPSRAR